MGARPGRTTFSRRPRAAPPGTAPAGTAPAGTAPAGTAPAGTDRVALRDARKPGPGGAAVDVLDDGGQGGARLRWRLGLVVA